MNQNKANLLKTVDTAAKRFMCDDNILNVRFAMKLDFRRSADLEPCLTHHRLGCSTLPALLFGFMIAFEASGAKPVITLGSMLVLTEGARFLFPFFIVLEPLLLDLW